MQVNNSLQKKLKQLQKEIAQYPSAVIAFSGGVDSTFLACIAKEVLGDKLLLVTACSSTYPEEERKEAQELAENLGIRRMQIKSNEMEIAGFSDNPPERCYYCKRELFQRLLDVARQEKMAVVFDGTNADDAQDYRPGRRALAELGIASPLMNAGMTKEDIRMYSREYGLATAEKPAYACLASRFPYGEKITPEKLLRVGATESAVRKLGFKQFRIRSHGNLARVELAPDELERGWLQRKEIRDICRKNGFTYAALDLEGYRTGAMNESLDKDTLNLS